MKSILMLAAIVLFAYSCNKNENTSITNDDISQMQKDNYEEAVVDEFDQSTDDITYQLDAAGYNTSGLKTATCYTITIDAPDSNRFPKTISIDYGTGCTSVVDGDTITRKGSLTMVVTGRYTQEGAIRSISFNNFYINDVKFEGTRIVTTIGLDSQFNFSWTYELKNGKITFPDGTYATRESSMTRTRVSNGTLNRLDDYLNITGSVQGINTRGEAYFREIVLPLRRNLGCRFFVSGAIENTRNDNVFTIDYGNGTCDRMATLTKNGETTEIRLRWRNN